MERHQPQTRQNTIALVVIGNHPELVDLLLKHSADRGHRNGEGKAGIRQLPSEWDVISKRSGC
ncbi:hypothetical protein ACO22_01629 [Paracoccidioides brasiliensis]|uniref:Ankyrin repeat protein n=1 Tax=Paracoccidioides brasiliensis TaxID=121759 RepID=A0A1D2JL10_PARBR|nr:hypothetical protein ACO22_01629 [Paracoccidioides brasiliensis]